MLKIGTFRSGRQQVIVTRHQIFLPVSARFLTSIPHYVRNFSNLPDNLVESHMKKEPVFWASVLCVKKVQ
jgi:hypothetical protein